MRRPVARHEQALVRATNYIAKPVNKKKRKKEKEEGKEKEARILLERNAVAAA